MNSNTCWIGNDIGILELKFKRVEPERFNEDWEHSESCWIGNDEGIFESKFKIVEFERLNEDWEHLESWPIFVYEWSRDIDNAEHWSLFESSLILSIAFCSKRLWVLVSLLPSKIRKKKKLLNK